MTAPALVRQVYGYFALTVPLTQLAQPSAFGFLVEYGWLT
jgi:hypothetical protein